MHRPNSARAAAKGRLAPRPLQHSAHCSLQAIAPATARLSSLMVVHELAQQHLQLSKARIARLAASCVPRLAQPSSRCSRLQLVLCPLANPTFAHLLVPAGKMKVLSLLVVLFAAAHASHDTYWDKPTTCASPSPSPVCKPSPKPSPKPCPSPVKVPR